MKIAELFVALGFKVEGGDTLQKVDQGMNRANVSALGLLAAVTAVNAAFYVMMNRAVNAAVGLDRFDRSSNVSTERLQKMQYGAARVNVAAGAIADGIKLVEKTRAEISLGNVDATSPWFLLGIDPRQDPIKVLEQFRQALAGMDPALQRSMATRAGFSDDMLYLFQQKEQFGSIFVTQDEIDKLARLGGVWKGFLFNVSVASTKFAASFADGLQRVFMHLDRVVLLFAKFTQWLNSSASGASALRTGLMFIVLLLGLAMGALTGVVFLLGLLKAALIAIQLIPIVAALSALVAVVALVAAGIVFLILMIQDFWTAIDGGKSLFNWNENLLLSVKNVERLAKAMEWVRDTATQVASGLKNIIGHSRGYGFGPLGEALFGNPDGYKDKIARPSMGGRVGGGTNNNAKVEVYVDGARDPVTTGREVGKSVGRELSDALGMAPIPIN